MSVNLDKLLPVRRCSAYSNPLDSAAICPRVYGDFYSTVHLPNDHADGGFLPAVCIDQFNLVYMLNDGPAFGPPPWIYANDVVQPNTPSLYEWFPASDYENRGHIISYIKWNVPVGSRQISWRGYGTSNPVTQQIITNPIDALADAFGYLGGWQPSDIDAPSVAQTKADMNFLGDTVHWCFQEDKSYREWLKDILRHYHTDFWENDKGQLRVLLDRSVTTLPIYVLKTINAETELVGTPSRAVRYSGDAVNLINTVQMSRRKKWTSGTYTDVPTVANQASVNVYGYRYKPFELPACYSDAEGLRWFQGLMTRYAFKPYELSFRVRGLSLMTALPGTFLGFLWPKQGWSPTARLIKVLEMTPNFDEQYVSFRCFDCGRSVVDEVILPTVPIVAARRRIAEAPNTVDTTPPGPASNLTAEGSFRQIVIYATAPGDLDYDYTEIWASGSNDRTTAVPVRSAGYVTPGQPWQETFNVGDNETYYVWLMTVDGDGNGRNGGSGVTGGNWYPNSISGGTGGWPAGEGGGYKASSTLVPTDTIEPRAVTKIYITGDRSLGTRIGKVAVAHVFLQTFYPQGDVLLTGSVNVTISGLNILAVEVHQQSVDGPIVGRNYFVNPFNAQLNITVDCWGSDLAPPWNGFYQLTTYAVDQAGVEAGYQVFGADLIARHFSR